MKYDIIKTDNYLLVVDDSEIIEGKTLLSKEGIIHTNIGWNFRDKVIISHLPLNNSPILNGVDLLPPLEDEVEKLAQQEFDRPHMIDIATDITPAYQQGFIVGYNKAKEKYKYTEEDIRKAINMATTRKHDSTCIFFNANEIIQSLQQPKYPIEFKCEMEILRERPTDIRNHIYDKTYEEHKTTTNSQGHTELVGKYIYP